MLSPILLSESDVRSALRHLEAEEGYKIGSVTLIPVATQHSGLEFREVDMSYLVGPTLEE